ncbi:MAG: glycosyltransferase family 2 protein [Mariprofundus sp.]|nr:glycosyltransferase family 2 protein [Mariprofundus sp.]
MNHPELSICIPTYNRAPILDETLRHLAEIDGIRLEVIVSDNASDDLTAEVANKFKDKFCRFSYHQQSENIGPGLNIQAALNLATSEFSYFLSDDDRIVPDSFRKILNMFQNNPEIVAVYGNHCEFDPYTGKEYEIAKTIKSEEIYSDQDRGKLFENTGMIWGPVMRTNINQRFCYYDSTTFGHWRQAEMLIRHGLIALIPDLIYKHAQTIPRMEFDLIEPWYHDMHRSDYELFIAGLGLDHSMEGITQHVVNFVHSRSAGIYMTAYNFATQQEKYIQQRHYLLRAHCYALVSDVQLKEWEHNFILHCALERVETILKSLPDVKRIILESSPIANFMLRLRTTERFSMLPPMEACTTNELLDRGTMDGEMILVADFSTLQQRRVKKQGYEFSLYDIVSTLRVARGHLEIGGL